MTLRTHHLAALILALALFPYAAHGGAAAGARAAAEDSLSTSHLDPHHPGQRQPQPELPTLWLIGDSTVRNGTLGTGGNGQWGWGAPIATTLRPEENQRHQQGHGRHLQPLLPDRRPLWPAVLAQIKSGDFVLMQFGHNDGGSLSQGARPGQPGRASIRGNGEETEAVRLANGTSETVHTLRLVHAPIHRRRQGQGRHPDRLLAHIPRKPLEAAERRQGKPQ